MVKKHTNGTGGGEPAVLTDMETNILNMMSPYQVNGLLTLKEPVIKFDFEQVSYTFNDFPYFFFLIS